MAKAPKTPTKIIYRDSETGKITTKTYAAKHPTTTEKETIKLTPRKGK
jgi:hypothetical protein